MKHPCPRTLAAAVLAAAACRPTATPTPRSDAAPQASSPAHGATPTPAPQAGTQPPPARWALVYRRACNASITPPVLSPDGAVVSACGARFDVARGRFLGAAPADLLALLPGDRALVDEKGGGGLAVLGPSSRESARDPGGRPAAIAVSPDGARVVSLETQGRERLLIVRELPSLRRVRSTSLGPGPGEGPVGFLPDGRELVFASTDCVEEPCPGVSEPSCRTRRCADPSLFAAERGALVPLGAALSGLSAAALDAAGDAAAVVHRDGTAALVSLPTGRTIAGLPPLGEGATVDALAVSPGGDRVAIAAGGRLAIHARTGSTFVEVLAEPRRFTRSMTFAADGRTLFAGDDLAVYREGAAPREIPRPRYEVALPPGFARLEQKDGEFVWPVPGEDRSSPLGTFAFFAEPKLGVEVHVVALDPDEIDPAGDALAWGRRWVERLFPHLPLATATDRAAIELQAWGDAGAGRSAQLHVKTQDGAPIQAYHRIAERDGGVVHVELKIPGEIDPKRVARWLTAFFDAPLGPRPIGAR